MDNDRQTPRNSPLKVLNNGSGKEKEKGKKRKRENTERTVAKPNRGGLLYLVINSQPGYTAGGLQTVEAA